MKTETSTELSAATGLFILLIALTTLFSAPEAPASPGGGGEIIISWSGPAVTERGYLTRNPDGTYFPGDFFLTYVNLKSAGKRGRARISHTESYTRKSNFVDDVWYDDYRKRTETVSGGTYDNYDPAEEEAENECERHDVIDCWVHETDDNRYQARWTKRWWNVDELELVPEADVSVVNEDGTARVEVSDEVIDLVEGEHVPEQVYTKLGEDTDPGGYRVEIEMSPPDRGHNNPYEDVSTIQENASFEVVEYDPIIRRIPYLAIERGDQSLQWMVGRPNAVVTRYDGSGGEDGENSPGRRVVVSGISASGRIGKPLRADGLYLRVDGDGLPTWSSSDGELRLDFTRDHVALGPKGKGEHYSSGSIVSPVFDAENFTGDGDSLWEGVSVETETPGKTGVEIYIRAGDDLGTAGVGGEWVNLDDADFEGRYFQYWMVLYTGKAERTPKVGKLSFETSDHEWTVSEWDRFRRRKDLKASPSDMEYFYSNKSTGVWKEGEVMRDANGIPKKGRMDMVARSVAELYPPTTSLNFELQKRDLPDYLEERTNTLDHSKRPHFARIDLEGVTIEEPSIERDGEKVFPFEPATGSTFRYRNTARYKKWNFFLNTRWDEGSPEFVREDLEFYKDATIEMEATLWFHQKVSLEGFEHETLKPAFTTGLTWTPMADRQPVRVAAWELKEDAKANMTENPDVVHRDDAWKIDDDVEFELTFRGMENMEDLMQRTRDLGDMMENWGIGGAEEMEEVMEGLSGFENLAGDMDMVHEGGFDSMDAEMMRADFESLIELDNEMADMILEDVEPADEGPQQVSGEGRALENVDYRWGGYFMVDEKIRPPGDNAVEGEKITRLPFDPERTVMFPVNVSGDGFVAEVVKDTESLTEIKVHTPERAGKLETVKIYNENGTLLLERNYASHFARMPGLLGGGEEAGDERRIVYRKLGDTPKHLEVVMTNEWGYSTRQVLEVVEGEVDRTEPGDMLIVWLFLAGAAAVAWNSFVRWWRGRRQAEGNSTQ